MERILLADYDQRLAGTPLMADVLLVEDTGLQAMLIKRFLSDAHTVVGTAETAKTAVELAQTTQPDAVVMDLRLAGGNGIEATKKIKSMQPAPAVIVSTVAIDQEIRQQAFAAGADEYLTKPYQKPDLLAAIEESLE
jgi:two-component system chemotaxis response regulator CheY